MEYDKELEASISQALREVEVDDTPAQRRSREVKREKMVVLLDQNFMARVPENVIRHSKELKLHKKIAEQQEKIALLMNAIDLLLDQ